MDRLILIALLTSPITSTANCNEVKALSKILFAESENQSIEGIVALGEAAINRSKRTKLSLCKIHGVTRREPNKILKNKWEAVAKSILKDNKKSTVGDADSWNIGKKPNSAGDIKRVIQKHVFYKMNGELK
jgi:hypothetical protein